MSEKPSDTMRAEHIKELDTLRAALREEAAYWRERAIELDMQLAKARAFESRLCLILDQSDDRLEKIHESAMAAIDERFGDD